MPQRTKLSVSKGLPVNTSTKSRAAKYTQRKGPKMKMALMPDKMRDKFRTPRLFPVNSRSRFIPLFFCFIETSPPFKFGQYMLTAILL